MKLRIEQAKILMCLTWVNELYEELCREAGEEQLKNQHKEFNRLIQIIKAYIEEYKKAGWYHSPKFRSAFVQFNRRLECLNRELPIDLEFYPAVLAIGILRHAPLQTTQGFDKIRDVDMDALITWAKENQAFKWQVQRYCQDFKKFYWES